MPPPGTPPDLRAGYHRPGPPHDSPPHDSPPLDCPPSGTATTRLVEALAVLAVLALYVVVVVRLNSVAWTLPLYAP